MRLLSLHREEVSSLKRRGVLKAVGGRPGHTLYAPGGMELEKVHREDNGRIDDAIIVLEALWRGYKRLKRALISTPGGWPKG